MFSPLSPTQCVAWSMYCSSHASNCLVECVADGRNGVLVSCDYVRGSLLVSSSHAIGLSTEGYETVSTAVWHMRNVCMSLRNWNVDSDLMVG